LEHLSKCNAVANNPIRTIISGTFPVQTENLYDIGHEYLRNNYRIHLTNKIIQDMLANDKKYKYLDLWPVTHTVSINGNMPDHVHFYKKTPHSLPVYNDIALLLLHLIAIDFK